MYDLSVEYQEHCMEGVAKEKMKFSTYLINTCLRSQLFLLLKCAQNRIYTWKRPVSLEHKSWTLLIGGSLEGSSIFFFFEKGGNPAFSRKPITSSYKAKQKAITGDSSNLLKNPNKDTTAPTSNRALPAAPAKRPNNPDREPALLHS